MSVPKDEFTFMEKICKKVVENFKKIELFTQLCDDTYSESAQGLTAQQIIDLLKDFLKDDHNEVDTYIFLHLLAYYPKSMTSHNLTPLMQGLIALAYYYPQCDKEAPKLSMDGLSELFQRSKATIYAAVQKHSGLEKTLKAELEEDRLRVKARKEAYEQLLEEEKQKLRIEKQNNERIAQMTE